MAKKGFGRFSTNGFELTITLAQSEPSIWRRVIVPANLTLAGLHIVIQMAMGWNDSHLHEFEIGEVRYTGYHPFEDFDDTGEDDSKISLAKAIGKRKKFLYQYDFGDSWMHTIVVEKVIPVLEKPIVCTDGEMACPPEDCGGLEGYYEQLAILNDKEHPDHAEVAEWMGKFNPKAFNIDAVNRSLARLSR